LFTVKNTGEKIESATTIMKKARMIP